ncbi:MAG TPA: oligosaccharide flippase family protein [Polyangiaceae bacterium]|nr:oligosaccharide flippase family protein [Polyangiaceae bacterium]
MASKETVGDSGVSEPNLASEPSGAEVSGAELSGSTLGGLEANVAGAESQQADARLGRLRALAQRGVATLVLRTVVVQVVTFGGQIALARLLEPKDFGIFAIVQFALSFFVFFGDAGLGSALIQKKEAPTREELSSVFFVQLLIALSVIVLVFVCGELIPLVWKDLPASAPWLLRALSLGFLLTTLRTLPAILMERELHFGKLAVIDLVYTMSFYVTAPTLAWLGYGPWALVISVLVQGVAALVVAYALRPFRPALMFNHKVLRPVLKFGVPFQLNKAVAFVAGALTPIYAGSKLGSGPLGYINWAQSTAYFPLRLVDVFGRIAFPLYSRLQDDRPVLGETFGRTVYLCATVTAYFVGLIFGLGPSLIHIVFGDKWLPALPLLYVYAVTISFGFLAPLVGALLDSTGRPGLLLRLALLWTALNWAVVPITTSLWGMFGFALGYAVHVVAGNLLLVILADKIVPHARLLRRVAAPALTGGLTFAAAKYGCADWVHGPFQLVGAILALIALHLGALLVIDRKGLREALSIMPAIKNKA